MTRSAMAGLPKPPGFRRAGPATPRAARRAPRMRRRKIAAEPVTATENGREKRMSMLEFLLRQTVRKGAKGDAKATLLVLRLVDQEDRGPQEKAEDADDPSLDGFQVHQTLLRMRESIIREGITERAPGGPDA